MISKNDFPQIAALCGGVGGSKFVEGLARVLPADRLTVIGNTGDDFIHLGLRICPDLDTVLYRLAGRVNREAGWGRQDESWRVMAEIRALEGPDWFQLGDTDLAVHLLRTHWLGEGLSLTEVTGRLCARFGVKTRLLPMSDELVPTIIETEKGRLPFQEWFVRERWQPPVKRVLLPQNERTTGAVVDALESADVIVIVPSNPYVSIDPILNMTPVAKILRHRREKVVALSPLVGDTAVKGPAAKMMADQGRPVTAATVLDHYRPYIGAFVQDERDREPLPTGELPLLITDTLMTTIADEVRLAAEVLSFARDSLR